MKICSTPHMFVRGFQDAVVTNTRVVFPQVSSNENRCYDDTRELIVRLQMGVGATDLKWVIHFLSCA